MSYNELLKGTDLKVEAYMLDNMKGKERTFAVYEKTNPIHLFGLYKARSWREVACLCSLDYGKLYRENDLIYEIATQEYIDNKITELEKLKEIIEDNLSEFKRNDPIDAEIYRNDGI